ALEEQLDPPPSTFDTATFFLIAHDPEPLPFGIIAFTKSLDTARLVKQYFPNATTRQVAGKTVYVNGKEAIYFPSDRQAMFGMVEGMEQYLAKPVATTGIMQPAIELATSRPVVVAGNLSSIPMAPGDLQNIPPDLQPLLKAQTVLLSLEMK